MSEHKQERPYPASLSFLLNNPIRRWLQPPSELLDKLEIKPTDVVMDFGCGPGYYTFEIAKRAKQVIAVDISSEMLKKVQANATKRNVKNMQYVQSDGKNIQIEDQAVNMVLLVTVYHEIHDHEIVLKEFNRILKREGKLAIVEVVKESRFPGAPIQNPTALKAEIEGSGFFRLEKTLPYKRYGILLFAKNT
jgi:ubiquinone/menaquinone biosynthesis C-methylase UbiE